MVCCDSKALLLRHLSKMQSCQVPCEPKMFVGAMLHAFGNKFVVFVEASKMDKNETLKNASMHAT